jgi:hypothetical protein
MQKLNVAPSPGLGSAQCVSNRPTRKRSQRYWQAGAEIDLGQKHPAIPVTPRQIADSPIEAAHAGAPAAHIHVRVPALSNRIGVLIDDFTAAECRDFFNHAGYASARLETALDPRSDQVDMASDDRGRRGPFLPSTPLGVLSGCSLGSHAPV